MSRKVAVVTGSNKGIGFAIVRGLCKQFDGDVYLTARNEGLGQKAVEDLKKEGLNPLFHQLDISSSESIQALKKFVQDKYGGLDVLVNNAGMAYKFSSTAPFQEQVEVTVKVNFWGTLEVCKALFPILRPHARVVQVSSSSGNMALNKCSPARKQQVLGCKQVTDVEKLITIFQESVKAGTHKADGWPETAYGMSKLGVTAMTIAQQADFNKDSRQDIIVNSCCPGYVDTDMSSHKGSLTIDQGAETPIYAAMLPPNTSSPKGEMLKSKSIKKWQ